MMPAARNARMFRSSPSAPKSKATSFTADATSNTAPPIHNVRVADLRAQIVRPACHRANLVDGALDHRCSQPDCAAPRHAKTSFAVTPGHGLGIVS